MYVGRKEVYEGRDGVYKGRIVINGRMGLRKQGREYSNEREGMEEETERVLRTG